MSNAAINTSGLQAMDGADNTSRGRGRNHQLISKMHSFSDCLAPDIIPVDFETSISCWQHYYLLVDIQILSRYQLLVELQMFSQGKILLQKKVVIKNMT